MHLSYRKDGQASRKIETVQHIFLFHNTRTIQQLPYIAYSNMWWKFETHKANLTSIPRLLADLKAELATSLQIQPFDKVFDEDILSSNYEKIYMLDKSIEGVINSTHVDFEVIYRFIEMKQQTEKHIEELLLKRAIRYAEWKKEFIKLTDRQIAVTETIKELEHIDRSIQKLVSKRSRIDIMSATMFHNMINTLLKAAGYDKQNMPYSAFTNALNKGLIDERVYKKLMTYCK